MKILPLRESAFLISDASHASITHQAVIKADNKSQFSLLSLQCTSEKQLAGGACGGRLAAEESSRHSTQLQLPPQRQLLGTANQPARTSCLILGTRRLQLYCKMPKQSKALEQAGGRLSYQAVIHTQFCQSARLHYRWCWFCSGDLKILLRYYSKVGSSTVTCTFTV